MAKVSYPYVGFPIAVSEVYPQGMVAFRPVARATITASTGKSARWLVLLDSGADACLFPLSMAKMLGLDVTKLPRALTSGVGSQSNVTWYDTVTIDLGQEIKFSAYVGFSEAMERIGTGLLGQSGFFERYRVEFLLTRKLFTIDSSL
jgi:hypothetical protein